jgi:hypothetical protein
VILDDFGLFLEDMGFHMVNTLGVQMDLILSDIEIMRRVEGKGVLCGEFQLVLKVGVGWV